MAAMGFAPTEIVTQVIPSLIRKRVKSFNYSLPLVFHFYKIMPYRHAPPLLKWAVRCPLVNVNNIFDNVNVFRQLFNN